MAAAQKYRAVHEEDRHSADVEICGKAVQWVLRHREFPQAKSVAATDAVLKLGQERLKELEADDKQWLCRPDRRPSMVMCPHSMTRFSRSR